MRDRRTQDPCVGGGMLKDGGSRAYVLGDGDPTANR